MFASTQKITFPRLTYPSPTVTDDTPQRIAGRAHFTSQLASFLNEDPNHTPQLFHQRKNPISQDAIVALLRRAAFPEPTLARISACSSATYVWRVNQTEELVLTRWRCGSRWCPSCANANRNKQFHKVQRHLAAAKAKIPLFVTFTQPHVPNESCIATFRRLQASWRRLVKSPYWKKQCRGCFFAYEVVKSKSVPNAWHWHLHVIADSNYLGYTAIRQAWCHASQVEFAVVRVEKPKKASHIHNYVCKYLTKPLCTEAYQDESTFISIAKTVGSNLRLHGYTGTLRQPQKTPPLTSPAQPFSVNRPDSFATYVGELESIIQKAYNNDTTARILLQCLNIQIHNVLPLRISPSLNPSNRTLWSSDVLKLSEPPPYRPQSFFNFNTTTQKHDSPSALFTLTTDAPPFTKSSTTSYRS